MNEEKYMTISAFRLDKNGNMIYSGLHQDIFLYRAKTGVVEEIMTNGMWIGIVENIDNMLMDDHLTLDKDDTLLLYTDGITEATYKKNDIKDSDTESNRFGNEKLLKTFGRLAHGTTESIIDGILEEMKLYMPDDDVTMLILKRV